MELAAIWDSYPSMGRWVVVEVEEPLAADAVVDSHFQS